MAPKTSVQNQPYQQARLPLAPVTSEESHRRSTDSTLPYNCTSRSSLPPTASRRAETNLSKRETSPILRLLALLCDARFAAPPVLGVDRASSWPSLSPLASRSVFCLDPARRYLRDAPHSICKLRRRHDSGASWLALRTFALVLRKGYRMISNSVFEHLSLGCGIHCET